MTDTLLLDSNALIALFDGDRGVARAAPSKAAHPPASCDFP